MALQVLTGSTDVPALYSNEGRKPLTLEIEQMPRTALQKLRHSLGLFTPKRTFQLYPFTLATAVAVCREMEKVGCHEVAMPASESLTTGLLRKYQASLSLIVAMAISNRGRRYKKAHRRLIEQQLTLKELSELMPVVNERMDLPSFFLALYMLGRIHIIETTQKD